MSKLENTKSKMSSLQERRIPCMITFIHPFRIINKNKSAEWTTTLEQINFCNWDYIALHEMVGGVDVGLENPYHMVICRDGAIAIPPLKELTNDTKAVQFFNKILASFLLGGIYCEAIGLDGLDFGSIIDWKYVRIQSNAQAAPNRFHNAIRLKKASAFEAIALEDPRTVELKDIENAYKIGASILKEIPQLEGEFLLKGVTGAARRDWGTALANLWIAIEQITSHLWNENIIAPAESNKVYPSRLDQLNDNRTWSISTRHELLYQKGVIFDDLFASLNTARKARNSLSHNGKHPKSADALAALNALKNLLQISLPNQVIPFISMKIDDHFLSDPFEPQKSKRLRPKYWMEIPKVPGEEEIERMEAEIFQNKNQS